MNVQNGLRKNVLNRIEEIEWNKSQVIYRNLENKILHLRLVEIIMHSISYYTLTFAVKKFLRHVLDFYTNL